MLRILLTLESGDKLLVREQDIITIKTYTPQDDKDRGRSIVQVFVKELNQTHALIVRETVDNIFYKMTDHEVNDAQY